MAPQFEEQVPVAVFVDGVPQAGAVAAHGSLEAQAYGALRLGVHDYLDKNGFPGAVIGLSGGIDSALTLAIAVDALGPDKVRTVMMPSQFTADISWLDSREMAHTLGVRYDEMPIKRCSTASRRAGARVPRPAVGHHRGEHPGAHPRHAADGAHQQVRLDRADHRQQEEMAVGYCTLYGDMAGGFAVIKDIRKTLVYRLARWRNEVSPVIPSGSSPARRAPS